MRIQQLNNDQYEKALRRYLGLDDSGGQNEDKTNQAVQDLENELEEEIKEMKEMKAENDQEAVQDDAETLDLTDDQDEETDEGSDTVKNADEKEK